MVIQNFWKVCISRSGTLWMLIDCSAFAAGTQNKNPVSCSSLRVHRVFQSTGSRISKDQTDLADSPSRSPGRRHNCPNRILASTAWIFHLTNRSTRSLRNSPGRWRRRSGSARSRQHSKTSEELGGAVGHFHFTRSRRQPAHWHRYGSRWEREGFHGRNCTCINRQTERRMCILDIVMKKTGIHCITLRPQ